MKGIAEHPERPKASGDWEFQGKISLKMAFHHSERKSKITNTEKEGRRRNPQKRIEKKRLNAGSLRGIRGNHCGVGRNEGKR